MQTLTSKELTYLSECLATEFKEVQKFTQAANEAKNPQCKTVFQNIAQMHQSHFDILKQHLNSNTLS